MFNIVIVVGVLITVATAMPVFTQMRKHPKGLHILFFAEMWERFSYYGMRAILIFYLTQHFLFDDSFSQSQYGAYTAMVYFVPLVGGFLADRYLGTRKAVLFGALLLVAGHSLMAVEQKPVVQVLDYQGASYEFVAEGRIDQRDVRIEVDGALYDFGADADGNFEIRGLPAGAPIPGTLAEGSYELRETGRSPVFVAIFYMALSLIIVGVGFLKANISTIVGQLYEEKDPRRDSGFTLYYYGINLGAFWSSILCGWLGSTVGWWAGFGLAGIGMLAGFVVFARGRLLFFTPGPSQIPDDVGRPPSPAKLAKPGFLGLSLEKLIYVGGLLGVFVVWGVMQMDASVRRSVNAAVDTFVTANGSDMALPLGLGFANFFAVIGTLLLIGSAIVLAYVARVIAKECTKAEAGRMLLALVLIAAAVVFWTLFEQAGSSLNQFAERSTDLVIFAEPIRLGSLFIGTPQQLAAAGLAQSDVLFVDGSFSAGQTQSFNAGFILIFAPVMAALWALLDKVKMEPNDPLKFALALLQVGIGFLMLVWGAQFAGPDFKVPLIFLTLLYLFHTTGELFMSPVGLSAITKLSLPKVVSTMMAMWFLSSAWAQWLGAIIATLTKQETVAGVVMNPGAALDTYVSVFGSLAMWAIGIGVVMGAASPWLGKLARGDTSDRPVGAVEPGGPAPDRPPS